jgi:hypothetical protein
MEGVTFVDIAAMTDDVIEQWKQEVAALPKRKLKNWKPSTGNPREVDGSLAQAHAVVTDEGITFEQRLGVRSAALRGLPAGSWLRIVSVTECAEMACAYEATGGQNIAVSPEGDLVQITADNDEFLAHAAQQVVQRHTGAHRPRGTTIRIPTRPGEPVRG